MAKYRKMLSDWDAPYIQAMLPVIESQSKQTLANWTLSYAERVLLPLFSARREGDARPADALAAARAYLAGEIKLPAAKAAIAQCNDAAREAGDDPVALAAARAVGQCAATIHTPTHCIGLALYGALAVAYDALGADAEWAQLEARAAEECAQMLAALQTLAVADEPNKAKLNWNC